jgi:hypothetical protein
MKQDRSESPTPIVTIAPTEEEMKTTKIIRVLPLSRKALQGAKKLGLPLEDEVQSRLIHTSRIKLLRGIKSFHFYTYIHIE